MTQQFDDLFNRGIQQLNAMQWADAAVTFETYTKEQPGLATAWANLAIAYSRLREVDSALHAGQRSVDIDPKSGGSWISLATAQIDAGLFGDAAASAEIATKLVGGEAGSVPQGTAALAYEALGNYRRLSRQPGEFGEQRQYTIRFLM